MITHKTLYSKTSTGATQIWRLEQEASKYRAVSGQLNGQLVIHDWTICEGKNLGKANETTPENQCTKEVEALYKKKLKADYFEDIEDIDKVRFVAPMLAKNFNDYKEKLSYPLGIQCKFNGSRCVITKDGAFTRKGERYLTIQHITDGLKWVFDKYPDAVLDGELFNYDLREKLNELMSLVRRTVHITQEDLDNSKKMVRFYCYDGYNFGIGKEDGYAYRKAVIDKIFKNEYASGLVVKYVDTWVVNSEKELNERYNLLLEDKQEGGIIRVLNAPYENKRSKYLLKLKNVDDAEFTITGISEGSGNWAGKAKIVHLKEGFDATFKGTMEQAIECLKEKDKWIGKKVTICYNGKTAFGVPNFAQFEYSNAIKS